MPEETGLKMAQKEGREELYTSPEDPALSGSYEPAVANRNIVAFIILLGIFMFVIDGSVVSIALPTITRYFRADVAQSQWVITSYLVTVTSFSWSSEK